MGKYTHESDMSNIPSSMKRLLVLFWLKKIKSGQLQRLQRAGHRFNITSFFQNCAESSYRLFRYNIGISSFLNNCRFIEHFR